MSVEAWIAVALLGGTGAVARLIIGSAVVAAVRGVDLPVGTLFVNLTGSFALGLAIGAGLEGTALFIVAVGLLGSYTTFSSWMLETGLQAEWGRPRLALLYVALSLFVGLAVIALGRLLGSAII